MASDTEAVFDGHIVLQEPVNAGPASSAALLTARFVHYPGAQQLIVWLPASGYQGYRDLRVDGPAGIVEEEPVARRLNGSVQILFYTVSWPPGDYRIEISHDEGWRHVLSMTKLEAGVAPPPDLSPQPEPEPELFERNARGDIIYRDGTGAVIPDADMILREEVFAKMSQRFSRRLEFEGNFRGGTIHYVDGERRISFWHEMAGGGFHMFIDIPPADKWEAATGTPLTERDDIVAFVAEETRRRQASSWTYEITATEIRYF